MFKVILYYYYLEIKDVDKFLKQHLNFFEGLDIKGRIIISQEGINGTLSGLEEDVDNYMNFVKEDLGLEKINFKIDDCDSHVFPKLSIKIKPELCNLSLNENIDPTQLTGKHLNPKLFYDMMLDPNTVIIDARNDYEFNLGHFKGAINPKIKHFRDLPKWLDENIDKFKNKNVLTYCTGGVRCEKFSGYMIKKGIKNVFQLDGGIVSYRDDPKTRGKLWKGKCYVFDQRISIPINKINPEVVGKDYISGEPCERYINCSNPKCNKHILLTIENDKRLKGACSQVCLEIVNDSIKNKETEIYKRAP